MIVGSSKKQESTRKTSISALLTMPKPLTVWITINCGKFFKRWGFKEAWEEGDLKELNVPPLPLVRVYLLPDEGELFGHSDFDQQELKLVAHYENGALAE